MLSIKPRQRAGKKGGSFLDNITHRKSFNHISVRKLKNVGKSTLPKFFSRLSIA